MEFLTGPDVLAAVAELAAADRRPPLQAAVAYVGHNAPRILPLRPGDVIVLNGSDQAVASGATDPRAVEEWLDAEVRVVNHRRLHAKAFVSGQTAIIGSANLSDRARTGSIVEAAARTTQPDAVAAVRVFINDLIADDGEDIYPEWVDEAKKRFATRRIPRLFDEEVLGLKTPFRLWLGWWNELGEWAAAEECAFAEAVAESARDLRPAARYKLEGRVEGADAVGFFRRGTWSSCSGPVKPSLSNSSKSA